jgi:hypothetical protein
LVDGRNLRMDGMEGPPLDTHQVCIVAIFSCTVINVCPLLKEWLLWENKHFRKSSISLTHCPWDQKYTVPNMERPLHKIKLLLSDNDVTTSDSESCGGTASVFLVFRN